MLCCLFSKFLFIFCNTLQVVDLKHPNGWVRPSFTCLLILVLCFTCEYIGLALFVLTMSERDHNDHNQKDQCKNNPKPELQCLLDSERTQDVREYPNEQDKLLLAFLNIDKQFDQREITQENTPNSEFENLRI